VWLAPRVHNGILFHVWHDADKNEILCAVDCGSGKVTGSFKIPNGHDGFNPIHFRVGLQMILITNHRDCKTVILDRQSLSPINEMDYELSSSWKENATGIVDKRYWMFGHRLIRGQEDPSSIAITAPGFIVKTQINLNSPDITLSAPPFDVTVQDFRQM
jgi:hypothetical protein